MPARSKLERTHDQALRQTVLSAAKERIWQTLFLTHAIAWACIFLSAVIIFTAPWWWQKLAALPCASIVAAISISARRKAMLDLIPYIDPIRASNRTGQIVYQFIRPLEHTRVSLMTTTLEQLIASFLELGLAKIDTKLSASTQQMVSSAVPTIVTTIASVVVDLAENHKSTKAATGAK